jgi:hypothetical protein
MAQRYAAEHILTKLFKIFHQNRVNFLIALGGNSFSPKVLRGTQQSTGRRYLTRISDNACVLTLKSRAHILTNHKHTLLTSNLCAIKKLPITRHVFTDAWLLKKKAERWGSQEHFRELFRLKRIIAT